MSPTSKTGGSTGTNQYQVRGRSRAAIEIPVKTPDLAGQIDTPLDTTEEIQCGQVWGTRCKVLVKPSPDRMYMHDAHPARLVLSAKAPKAAWISIAKSGQPWAAHAVASNPAAPPEALETLANSDNDLGIQALVAGHNNAAPATIKRLLDSPYNHIAWAAACNPNCPPPPDIDQLRPVAAAGWAINERCTEDQLVALVERPDVASAVLQRHPAIPVKAQKIILANLRTNPDAMLASGLAARSDIDPQVASALSQMDFDINSELAANRSCPPEVLAQIAGTNISIDAAVAAHHNTPEETMIELSQNDSPYVRAVVLANRANCPPDALENLLKDPDRRISDEAWALHGADRPNLAALRGLLDTLGDLPGLPPI